MNALGFEERHDIVISKADKEHQHQDHLDRYRFAAQFTQDAKVLDIACGTGYGSRLLVEEGSASFVWGVDVCEDAITRARQHTKGIQAVEYLQGDGKNIPLDSE